MADSFPGKVLIIDDDQDILNIYSKTLIQAGYTVETAKSGIEGYAKLFQGGYDLVLLDVVMPDLDGISILKKLKQKMQEAQDNQSQDTFSYNGPIIILSQMDQPDIIETAFALGARGYLVKANVVPNELPAKISEIIQKAYKK